MPNAIPLAKPVEDYPVTRTMYLRVGDIRWLEDYAAAHQLRSISAAIKHVIDEQRERDDGLIGALDESALQPIPE